MRAGERRQVDESRKEEAGREGQGKRRQMKEEGRR
jgi:hypothetical protein